MLSTPARLLKALARLQPHAETHHEAARLREVQLKPASARRAKA